MKILLLSPYDAMSHRYWREGLVDHFPKHEFTVIGLPARHFSWRFRGNSLTLAHDDRMHKEFDLVLATSMTDLSSLKGMQPHLAQTPTVVYFHENQFAYPTGERDGENGRENKGRVLERQVTNLYTAIAADRVVFNSTYNRNTFVEGARRFLQQMPDQVPAGIVEAIEVKSRVLPVPLADDCFEGSPTAGRKGSRSATQKLRLVWNHRWEYDKGPALLLEILERLIASGFDFECHLLGQQFRQAPAEFARCVELLRQAGCLGEVGFLPRDQYLAVLRVSDLVLSTALHEFQGLSVLEAMACGCAPVVPNRLVYPELIDAACRYEDPGGAVEMIQASARSRVGSNVRQFSWSAQHDSWADVLKFAS